jgi:predicted ester cyclase
MMASATSEDAKRNAIEQFYVAFARKDVELLRQIVTPDWAYIPEPPGASPGPDQMTRMFHDMAIAIPDMKIDILDLLIHDDRVGVRAQVSGTQSGELLGIAATSKPVNFAIHSFHEMRGSLVSKTWHLEDWLGLCRQLGQLPSRLDLH